MLARAKQTEVFEESPHAQAESRLQALEALGVAGTTLHELDYEDLALSASALRLVRRAAASVLSRFCAPPEGGLPFARALALFLDHVFWDEKSGGLILCADFPGQSFCLPIPRESWGLKPRKGPVQ